MLNQRFQTAFITMKIDPIKCGQIDPQIQAFTGKSDVYTTINVNGENITKSDFKNPNNNSLVIKVTFGKTSFLFTGDLEEEGIAYLLHNYKNHLSVLEADVLQVGHHGSHNATSKNLLGAVKPRLAVISAGNAFERGMGTAWDHGHPNKHVVDLLQSETGKSFRKKSFSGLIFEVQQNTPKLDRIKKDVFCTCWDETIVLEVHHDSGIKKVSINN